MQGDTIILTEGINDLAFLEQLHARTDIKEYCDRFDNEASDETQTQRIRQHRIGNSISYLYKCEGGRSEVEKIFAREGPAIGDQGLRTVLMLDMDDDDSFAALLKSLNGRLREQWGSRISLAATECTKFTKDFVIKRCSLDGDGETFLEPTIIAFYEDMEAATGIPYGASSTKKKQQAEIYFQENPKVVETLVNTLYP